MLSTVPLLTVVALVSLQCTIGMSSFLENLAPEETGNNLSPPVKLVPSPTVRVRKYVHIASASPETMRSVHGEAVELHCEVYGSPNPTVLWLQNGRVIVDFEEQNNEIYENPVSNLARLTAKLLVPVPRDGDVYTCCATAGNMEQAVSTTIITDGEEKGKFLTLDKLLRLPAKPLIIMHYNELLQSTDTRAILPCRVQSMTKAHIYWNDFKGKLITDNSKFKVLKTGDLMINNIQWSDMGTYTCTVKNSFGIDTSETFLYPTRV